MDRLARAVARARIADKLFAKKQEVKLGRYHLLERIGAGGMGVVWGAFDPELDRRVAIKLVRAERAAARDRILAEGKALAKLSHPNVVTVYDVGVVDEPGEGQEQIYIVMEWVRGKTLRAHCREPRTVRELVALYRAAGEGLAAAHRAGLVHRDFKPDNAMVGDDGRVRVLDFGLARGEVRAAGESSSGGGEVESSEVDVTRGVGTPKYMPPEQAEGRELTPAADQYAFCVSLREALARRGGGERAADIPRWLDEHLARGTAREAAHRFSSMDALLSALARDPATVWRRRLLAAGAVAAAGAAFAAGSLRGGGDPPPALERCGGGPAELARAWSEAAGARVAAHLRGLGPYGAQEVARLPRELTAYGARWAAAHRDACLAQERGELTPALYAQSLGCLARAHTALATVAEVLAAAPVERLASAVVASRSLPDAARCRSDAQAAALDPPPAAIAAQVAAAEGEVARAQVLAVARDPRATEVAVAAEQRAAALGYVPLVAVARLARGRALAGAQATADAIAALDGAVTAALEAGDGRTATEAFARELYAIGISDRAKLPAGAAERLGALPFVEAIAKHLGRRGGFERALLYNNLGAVRLSEGDRGAARRWFEEARSVREATGAAEVELAAIWGNLAMVTEDRAARDGLFERRGSELERALGADHPMALDARLLAAMFVEEARAAAAGLERWCARYRELHPHLAQKISHCSLEVAWLAEELGERERARAAVDTALTFERGETFERKFAAAFRLALEGRDAEAAPALLALGESAGAPAQPWWMRVKAANALLAAAAAQRRLGRAAGERAALERALAVLEGLPSAAEGTYKQRRLARARAELARRLDADAAEPARARALAAAAAAWYGAAGAAATGSPSAGTRPP